MRAAGGREGEGWPAPGRATSRFVGPIMPNGIFASQAKIPNGIFGGKKNRRGGWEGGGDEGGLVQIH